ncbi:triK protein, partial [Salmonella enterica]|nr:triK protein [Salmonella enterica]
YLFTSWINVKEKVSLPSRNEAITREEKILNQEVTENQINEEILSGKKQNDIDKIDIETVEKVHFNPEEDPEFVRMLSEKVKGVKPEKPVKNPVSGSDLISSIGKKED